MFELSLSKPPTKEASPATARQARTTTEKYSLLFSFCARRIFSSFNESGGTGLILIWQEKSGIPPNPPFRFSLAQTEREQKQAGKNSFPTTPSLFARLLGLRPQNFRTDGFFGGGYVFCTVGKSTIFPTLSFIASRQLFAKFLSFDSFAYFATRKRSVVLTKTQFDDFAVLIHLVVNCSVRSSGFVSRKPFPNKIPIAGFSISSLCKSS